MTGRRGFVVVELVVVAAVAALLMASAWLFFGVGSRGSARLDRQTSSLRSRLIVWQRMTDDAERATRFELRPGESRDELTMWVLEEPDGAEPGPALNLSEVRFSRDPVSGQLLRNGLPVGGASVAGLRFAVADGGRVDVRMQLLAGTPGSTAEGLEEQRIMLVPGLQPVPGVLGCWQGAFDLEG